MEKYHKRACQEKYEVVKNLMAWNMKDGESVCNHLQILKRCVERLVRLNVQFDEELAINMVLNSFLSCYDKFILAYHLSNIETTLDQLHNLL